MPPLSYRQHETTFCAEVSNWSDKLFETHPELLFGSSEIESFGRGSLKRLDFRVYERKEKGGGNLPSAERSSFPAHHKAAPLHNLVRDG
jgi:hypothetical protein